MDQRSTAQVSTSFEALLGKPVEAVEAVACSVQSCVSWSAVFSYQPPLLSGIT